MNFVQTLTAVEKSRALSCAIRFLLAAILSGSQIFGAYAPFGLGFVAAAGAGMEGLSALLGLLVGALLMMPFTAAIKYIAAAILIFSVSVAFFDTKLYRKHAFLPLITAACTAVVGFGVSDAAGRLQYRRSLFPAGDFPGRAAAPFATAWRWQFRSTHRRPWNDSSFLLFLFWQSLY